MKARQLYEAGVEAAALDTLESLGYASLLANNRAFHRMLVEGIPVEYTAPSPRPSSKGRAPSGTEDAGWHRHEIVRLVDWDNPDANDWLVVNQFTVIEGQHNRRADVVVFVNGLPLAVFELKNAADENATVWDAFNQLQTYKQQIPSIFTYNALLVISDGLEARIGTLTSDKKRFMPWRTIEGETVAPSTVPQLEVLLRGVFEKRRFLDLIRHFIVFEEDAGGVLLKKMAGYHQFHAVRIAVEETLRACAAAAGDALHDRRGGYFARHPPGGTAGDRRIGVVWHTQGSGKSLPARQAAESHPNRPPASRTPLRRLDPLTQRTQRAPRREFPSLRSLRSLQLISPSAYSAVITSLAASPL